jgi:hypothetical protein
MGYAYYEFEDGHGPRGYSVKAVCAQEGCVNKIDKGLSFLCYSCTNYFCGDHLVLAVDPTDEDEVIEFDCFAGSGIQCCLACAREAEQEAKKEAA